MFNAKKVLTLQTIGSKIVVAALIGVAIFSTITQSIISSTIRESELNSVKEKEESDLAYMEDYLGEGAWAIKDSTLYKGDTLIGDGSHELANIEPFEYLESVTGSFFYTFMHKKYVKSYILSSVHENKDSNYLRVAGSTKDPQGGSIVQTYMEPNVSQKLDKDGQYLDFAYVEGGRFYCLYRTIVDEKTNNIIGAIVVGRSIDELNQKISSANRRIILFIVIGFILMIALLSAVIVGWIKNLKKSQNYLQQIANGTFPDEPLVIKSRDEMKEMAEVINNMTTSLKDKERIETELTLAQEIQINMLPKSFKNIADLGYVDVFASMQPAREVGGDFYDFFMIDDKNIALIIADVSGKGVPAALLMAIAKTMVKNLMISGYTIEECFSKINNILSEGNESSSFITAWGAVLNIETGQLTFANAGHNPPLIFKAGGKYEYLKSKPGFVLGGLPGIRYKQASIHINEGDRIFLYTDGVTEAHSKTNELYGETRLIDYLNSNKDKSIHDIVDGLKGDIKQFATGVDQSDDITVLFLDFVSKKEIIGITKAFMADKEFLYPCLDFINEQLDKAGCIVKAKNQINLVVEEFFMNVADHGYKSAVGDIEITVDIKDDVAWLIIKDRGVPFNPLTKEEPDISLSADDRKVGGLGIFIAKRMMDEIVYDYANGQNILTIKKRIK